MLERNQLHDKKNLGALFIVLYDEGSLDLYLKEGLYGFLMPPIFSKPSPQSAHYRALADYACARQDTHVFFFLQRKIVYAGQIIGSRDYGAFYLNGKTSPLGREGNANLYWNESSRYGATEIQGVFKVRGSDGTINERCQPFLIRFQDFLGLTRRQISSDDLYFELGSYPYPLPSNSIQGMGFCTLTPGETKMAMQLLDATSDANQQLSRLHRVSREGDITLFSPALGIQNLQEAIESRELLNESHLEFSVIANPLLLPAIIRPSPSDVICRQVPISPFKPSNMDRADICYYDTNSPLADGTLPNRIIELKKDVASSRAILQVERYLRWLRKITSERDFVKIAAYIFAPAFGPSALNYRTEFRGKITLVDFSSRTYIL